MNKSMIIKYNNIICCSKTNVIILNCDKNWKLIYDKNMGINYKKLKYYILDFKEF